MVLNNFSTRLGHRVGRLLGSLFPHDPQFKGRTVATFHNQRDFIFVRHHRYIFEGLLSDDEASDDDDGDGGDAEDKAVAKEQAEQDAFARELLGQPPRRKTKQEISKAAAKAARARKREKNKGKVSARLQELGPRFTLKMTWLQAGTFDTRGGEFEWVHKRKQMDTSRRKFHL